MDKNDELRNSLFFFVDEAIGFRKSLHHFHRWLETKEQSELDSLIVEVCREQNYDISPLLNAIRNNNEEQSIDALHGIIEQGLYATTDVVTGNSLRLPSLGSGIFSSVSLITLSSTLWQLRDWVNTNKSIDDLALAHQLVIDAGFDSYKISQLNEWISVIGQNNIYVGLDNVKLSILQDWADAYTNTYNGKPLVILSLANNTNGNTINEVALAHQQQLLLNAELDHYKLSLLKEWNNTNRSMGDLSRAADTLSESNLDNYKLSQLQAWTDACAEKYEGHPISVLALTHQLLLDLKSDESKLINLLEAIVGPNTLLSCIIDNDIVLFGKVVSSYYNDYQAEHINKLAIAINNSLDLNWKDALSRNQVKSKLWLIEKIVRFKFVPRRTNTILSIDTTATIVVGGWVGLIPFLCSLQELNLGQVINVDIDTGVHNAAIDLNGNRHNTFENSGTSIQEFDFEKYSKVLVIDTIVEHFENHGEWVSTLPKGTMVILQGNDMFDVPDHVNCHNSLEEFLGVSGLNTVIWSGELTLPKCTRFMTIGQV